LDTLHIAKWRDFVKMEAGLRAINTEGKMERGIAVGRYRKGVGSEDIVSGVKSRITFIILVIHLHK